MGMSRREKAFEDVGESVSNGAVSLRRWEGW